MFNLFKKASKEKSLPQEQAQEMLQQDENIILLDVRTPAEYSQKHIPKSILLPLDHLKNEAEKRFADKDATIFVYCRSGNRSAAAASILTELGYANTYNIGGIMSWPYETVKGSS